MKIDILTLAAAAMPLVPGHLKPLAHAVIDEFKAQREQTKAQAQHIAELSERFNALFRHVHLKLPASGAAH